MKQRFVFCIVLLTGYACKEPTSNGATEPVVKGKPVTLNADSVFYENVRLYLVDKQQYIPAGIVGNGYVHTTISDTVTAGTDYTTFNVPAGMHFKVPLGEGVSLWLRSGSICDGKPGKPGLLFDTLELNGEILIEVKEGARPAAIVVNDWCIQTDKPAVYSFKKFHDTLCRVAVAGGEVHLTYMGQKFTLAAGMDNRLRYNTSTNKKWLGRIPVGVVTAFTAGDLAFFNDTYATAIDDVGDWFDLVPVYWKPYRNIGAVYGHFTGNVTKVMKGIQDSSGLMLGIIGSNITMKVTEMSKVYKETLNNP